MATPKPDATPIRDETKKILKARAAMNGLSLVDYLEVILREYFEKTDKGSVNEAVVITKILEESEPKS